MIKDTYIKTDLLGYRYNSMFPPNSHKSRSLYHGYKTDRAFDFYKYKLKNLLTTVALGMVPAKPWNGYYDANGGYIVVKEDGDIICYHFYDRNRFETYLFNNAELERPSTTRHGYGTLEKDEDGKLYFKFNLQIRLK